MALDFFLLDEEKNSNGLHVRKMWHRLGCKKKMWHWIGCKKKSGLGANPKMHLYTLSLSPFFITKLVSFENFFNGKEEALHDAWSSRRN